MKECCAGQTHCNFKMLYLLVWIKEMATSHARTMESFHRTARPLGQGRWPEGKAARATFNTLTFRAHINVEIVFAGQSNDFNSLKNVLLFDVSTWLPINDVPSFSCFAHGALIGIHSLSPRGMIKLLSK